MLIDMFLLGGASFYILAFFNCLVVETGVEIVHDGFFGICINFFDS